MAITRIGTFGLDERVAAQFGTAEHSLPRDNTYAGDSPQSGDGLYRVFLDTSALLGGDLFRFRVYEEVVV